MAILNDFKISLHNHQPDEQLSVQLKSLWYDGKGNWQLAHEQVDHLNDSASCHIHAYLHRKEGDIWNADYWYRRAKKVRPEISLEAEWEQLVTANL